MLHGKKDGQKILSNFKWLRDRFLVTKERIILLQNKNLTTSEIADEIEFSSRSFFTRYVKKLLGATPSKYRSRLG
jgi:AraC-like DNA-binding protein